MAEIIRHQAFPRAWQLLRSGDVYVITFNSVEYRFTATADMTLNQVSQVVVENAAGLRIGAGVIVGERK